MKCLFISIDEIRLLYFCAQTLNSLMLHFKSHNTCNWQLVGIHLVLHNSILCFSFSCRRLLWKYHRGDPYTPLGYFCLLAWYVLMFLLVSIYIFQTVYPHQCSPNCRLILIRARLNSTTWRPPYCSGAPHSAHPAGPFYATASGFFQCKSSSHVFKYASQIPNVENRF